MTHLKIELSNVQENVSSAVVEKLYELVTSGDLDVSSNLAGNIHTTATYQEYIAGIRNRFNDLTITSDKLYILISDPAVRSVMATRFGDGVGITALDLIGVTAIPQALFKDNTDIQTFDELNSMNGIKTLSMNSFYGCSNLTSIGLQNITRLGAYCLRNCSSLLSVDLSNIEEIDQYVLNGTGITRIVLPKIISVAGQAFNNGRFTYIEFGENLLSLGAACFWDNARLSTLVFRGTTPVSYSDSQRNNKFLYNMNLVTIYVPDESLTAYKTEWPNMESRIVGISQLPST